MRRTLLKIISDSRDSLVLIGRKLNKRNPLFMYNQVKKQLFEYFTEQEMIRCFKRKSTIFSIIILMFFVGCPITTPPQKKVAGGFFNSASEFVRKAVRRMLKSDNAKEKGPRKVVANRYFEEAERGGLPDIRYRLFETKNIWTKLLLDTKTGKIWQVTFTVSEKYIRAKVPINDKKIVNEKDGRDGRFTLYPTSNMWNFILLDQENGNVWQCQYSMNENQRFIIPILEKNKSNMSEAKFDHTHSK